MRGRGGRARAPRRRDYKSQGPASQERGVAARRLRSAAPGAGPQREPGGGGAGALAG